MKEKYVAVIIDDEPLGIRNLRQSLLAVEKIELVMSAENAEEGRKMILHVKPDLIFMDIEMPDMSGIDLLKQIKDKLSWPVKVVFYSAYNSYAIEAFRESAFDFLLKPYLEKDFNIVIERFFNCMEKEDFAGCSNQAIKELGDGNDICFLVPSQNGYSSIRIQDVGFFEYKNDIGCWHVAVNGQSIALKKNTSAKSILKLSEYFKQISKKHIVNILFLSSISGKEKKVCNLFPPFHAIGELPIKNDYYRPLQDSFYTL